MNNRIATYCLPLLLAAMFAACANRGSGPQGGPKDTTPPKIVKTTPENGVLQFNSGKIDLSFDEYILLNNPADNIIISPPQLHPPQINAYGKKIHIVFQDTLTPNTTYTIDFGSAIKDNNEGNPLDNYTFSFSTGTSIDSLEIYGIVLDAQTLNPKKGIIVGIQSNLDDTAFSALPLTRISKTNNEGEFSIKNIQHGSYRLYALSDLNRNYAYDPGEQIAFADDVIIPYISIKNEIDTIWKDTLINDSLHHIPDSVYTSQFYYYEPSELLLLSFEEDKVRSYLVKTTRDKQHFITFIFSRTQPQLPGIRFINGDTAINYTVSRNAGMDTITCWLRDSSAISTDSLQVELTYFKTDSAYNLFEQTDTLWTVFRPNKNKKAKKKTEDPVFVRLTTNVKSSINLDDTLTINSHTPVTRIDKGMIHLLLKKDTVYNELDFTLKPHTADSMGYQVIFPLKPQTEYELRIDSAAFTDMYGFTNNSTSLRFSSKAEEEYATLHIVLAHNDNRAVLQLLSEKDAVVKEKRAADGKTTFKYIAPGNYYLRVFIDEDGNGKWTTGDWLKHRQPEQVFYLNKKLTLKANWEFEEMFDWTAVPLTEQKPKQLMPK